MSRTRSLCLLLAFLHACCQLLAAQEPPPAELKNVPQTALRYVVQLPAAHTPERWVPVVVVFGAGSDEQGARASAASLAGLSAAGFVVVAPLRGETAAVPDLRPLFTALRRSFRIEQGGLHAAIGGDVPYATAVLLAHRHEFQTVTAFGSSSGADLTALQRLPARRVLATPAASAAALVAYFMALHAERTLPGAAGEVARVLDDFHDAAANGDEDRYFAILPDDAVFLGTDGTERWTGREFRAFAMRYFRRESAWTYVTLRRAVNVEPGGTIAWFDESFDNEAYGECRGSGVMMKRDGKWVVRQYHLTVPVPNDVTREVAARIRAFQDGVPPAAVTTILLVRHAEKVDESDDPELSEAGKQRAAALERALQDLRLGTVYTSQFRRTAATVADVVRDNSLTPVQVPANDVAGLAARLRDQHAGKTVLVCGHSNTVPKILKELGVAEPVTIGDKEYDRLFVVTLSPEGARMLSLRYGP